MKTAIFATAIAVALAGTAEAQFGTANGPQVKGPQAKTPVSKPVLPPVTASQPGSGFLGGSDDCSTPVPISGQGTFPFTNAGATTGVDGQSECIGHNQDIWFEWTADATGVAVLDTCTGSTFDTTLAIYPAGGCPTPGSSLDCNDDTCGLQSQVSTSVTSGTSYLVQIGAFSSGTTGTGNLEINIFAPPTNDDCTAPDVIAGQGSFAFNLIGATTGAEGQVETICNFFGSTTIDSDVWYEWTADATGTAVISTCGQTVDTKIALYPGTGCPGVDTTIACNDDACGFQTQVVASVVSGTTYTIQIGTFPGAAAGAGSFDIDIFPPVTNDDCATPTAISGQGVFPYSNIGATTGVEGQNEASCFAFGSSGIDNDVWFEWTADADGLALISTCFQSATDTKLAAWPSGGCPADGSSLACNDDSCGLQSTIGFNVTNGTTYLIQAGNFPGATFGPSALDITIVDLPDGYVYDLGSTSNSLGLTAGGGIGWLHGFDAEGGSDTITEISSAYGTPLFPGLTPGQSGTVAIWDDPTNDFDPSDAVLLYSAPITTANEDTDILNAYAIPNVPVSGVFFVGVVVENAAGQFPAPMDETFPSAGRAWIVGNTSAFGGFPAFDYANMILNDLPPTDMDAIGFPSVFLLRAVGEGGGLGTSYCTAAGNSVSPSGSRMSANGSASLAAQDVTLKADNAPTQPGLFYFGPNQIVLPFGNGFRCVGGTVIRMPVIVGNGGEFSYTIDFGTFGASLANLGTANFQCWYRDPAGGGAFFNLSDALEIVFQP